MPKSLLPSLVALLALGSLAGCAVVQVRAVGTNTGQAAYDLVGPSLQSLAGEAERLCPQGHAVLRQWQHLNQPLGQGEGSAGATAVLVALSYDLRPDQAQMSIVCRA